MSTKGLLTDHPSKTTRKACGAARGFLPLFGGALALACCFAGSARAGVDPATVADTSTLLNDSIEAMYVDSVSTDTEYWSGNIFAYPSSATTASFSLGPVSGAAELFNWRQKHNYTQPGADVATNIWLHAIAGNGINAVLGHVNADGSWEDATLPNTQMALAEISDTYLSIRDAQDPTSRKNWLNAMMQMINYLIVDGDLPDPNKTGWQGTSGYYTNGNIEILEAVLLYQLYVATGDPRYKSLFDTQYAATLDPDHTRWPNFGLRYSVTPTQPDDSDGAGYLVEQGSSYGYDGDYTQLQSIVTGRLYVLLPDNTRLQLLNLLVNQLLPHTNKNTWTLDATNGSRHSLVTGFFTEGMDVLSWLGGRSDLAGYAAGQFAEQIDPDYLGNAFQNFGQPGYYRGYGDDLGVMLHADLIGTSVPSIPSAAPTATVSNGQVTLAWPMSIGAVSYNVKRATTSGGPYTTVANSPSSIYTAAASNGVTYYYVVSAVNLAGQSGNSAQVQATAAAVAPAAPPAVACTAGHAQAALVWLQATGATTYNVKRATTSGGPYTTVAGGVSASNISPYLDKSLTNGTTYYYVVTAVNTYGESANSYETSATPQAVFAPRNLLVTAGNAQATLNWWNIKGATSYNVKRSQSSGGPYTTVASDLTTASYTDTGLTNGTTYYYVVSAVMGSESANSAQTATVPTPVPVPANVLTTATPTQVTVTWAPVTGATGYNVRRSTGGGYTLIGSGSGTSYTDTTVSSGTLYDYEISALNGSVEGHASAAVSVTPPPANIPGMPTGVSATGGTVAQVVVGWSAATGAVSYNVKRSTYSGGPYSTISSGSSATSFTDTRVTQGTKYYYVVSAVNAQGEGPNSGQVNGSVAPLAPTDLAATPGTAQATLTWQVSWGAASYNVKRATASGGPYTLVSNTTALTLTNTGLTSGQTYYYVVSAVNVGGESSNSAPVSVVPN